MVKKIINRLDIRYVSNANEGVAAGEQHIFEVISKSEGTLSTYSFCGRTAHEIGDETTTPQKIRDPKLPVCLACSNGWKADPRSPWARFAAGVPIR
jgi:hypothetical protein